MKTLSEYLKDKTGIRYYERIAAMSEEQLSTLWEEVDEKAYWWFLEFYVPAKHEHFAFAEGEPTCHGIEGTIHTVGVEFLGRYFLRPAYIEKFSRPEYVAEIAVGLK